MAETYVLEHESPGSRLRIENLNGVPWHKAPLPRRWHRCQAQTRGWDMLTYIERCACGAIRLNGRGWLDRNSTRRSRRAR